MKKAMYFLISLMLVGVVSAFTATINTPSQGGTISEDTMLNVSVAEWGDNDTIRCLITASSPTTANSSTSFIANITNATGQSESVNITFGSSLVLEDSDDYTFAATCYNDTAGGAAQIAVATSRTAVSVDRTVPSVATTSHTDGTIFDETNTNTITYSVNGANTSSCRIAFLVGDTAPRFTGSGTYGMTHTGNACTYTVTSNTIPDGAYNVYVQASDGTNTSSSVKRNYQIDTVDSNSNPLGDISVPIAEEVVKNEQLKKGAVIVVIIIFGYWIFFKKK